MIDYLTMLHWLANRCHNRTGVPEQDLFSEGSLAMVKAMPGYDAGKAKVSTFVCVVAYRKMESFAQREIKATRSRVEPSVQIPYWSSTEHDVEFRSQIDTLPPKPRAVCQMILDDPNRFDGIELGDLSKHLRDMGWKWRDIKSSVGQIREALRAC
jgi:DNA-directed RNA polymerase specialized sigma24 family protein